MSKYCGVKRPGPATCFGTIPICALTPGHNGPHQTLVGEVFTTRWDDDMEAGAIG